MPFDKPAVVIDNGGFLTKAGFSCDNHPVSLFRTLVGRPSRLMGKYGRVDYYDVLVGDESLNNDDYEVFPPVVNGMIVNWDNMERIWHHVLYRELRVAPEDRSVFIICSPNTPMSEKMKCCQVFFEVLNIPAICIQPSSVLALYGSGLTTGVTIDIGFDTADINPVYEGCLIKYAQETTGYAGRTACQFLKNCLAERNIDVSKINTETLSEMIRNSWCSTLDASVQRSQREHMYELPSGEVVDISAEAYLGTEMFFQPDLLCGDRKKDYLPLADALVKSTLKCEPDLRSELYNGIVMCGGMSTIPNLGNRLKLEIEKLVNHPVTLLASEESYSVAWMGGALFAGIPESKNIWVSKKQFEDHGIRIARHRFM